MEKIPVTVCLGTTCHLMGSAHLQSLAEQLPAHLQDRVTVRWVRCMNRCSDGHQGQAPFVIVGQEVVSEATLPKIIEKLEIMTGTAG